MKQRFYSAAIYCKLSKDDYGVDASSSIKTLNLENDIAPFKNVLNEMYAKDCSRKIDGKSSKNRVFLPVCW